MAAEPTPDPARPVLRVRLSGPERLHARAEWALEALLARARVVDWRRAGPSEPADLDWGGSGSPTCVDLPADEEQWRFRWDVEPDQRRDPLAATFWWLARVEEQLAPDDAFDEHGRFRAASSALVRRGDPVAAPVDELAAELAIRLARWQRPRSRDLPAWRLVVTHDVDLPVRWVRSGRRRALRSLRDELRGGRIGAAARTVGSLLAMPVLRLAGRDPWDNFDRISELERVRGARSTSYLLAGHHAPQDGDEQLHARGAAYVDPSTIRRGADRVGLHGSYTSSEVDGRLEAERDALEARLGVPVLDHRFHYLRHRPVEAWPLLADAGFRSDSSLGYAEQPGFRAGTAHPFRAWDHHADAPLELVVIPLAVMDASYEARYLDLQGRDRRQHVDRVVDRVRDLGGSASLLVHNDRLCNAADDGWTRQYSAILSRVRREGGVACTAAAATAAYRDLLPAWRRSTT